MSGGMRDALKRFLMGDNQNSRATTIRIPDRKECLTPDRFLQFAPRDLILEFKSSKKPGVPSHLKKAESYSSDRSGHADQGRFSRIAFQLVMGLGISIVSRFSPTIAVTVTVMGEPTLALDGAEITRVAEFPQLNASTPTTRHNAPRKRASTIRRFEWIDIFKSKRTKSVRASEIRTS